MSYTTQKLAGVANSKGREPNVSYPYTLESASRRWVITSPKHAPVVYVVRAENGLVKIGRASDVVNRIAALDRASPIPTRFLHLILTNNAYELERELHEGLAESWVRGEWFRLEPADIEAITDLEFAKYKVQRYPGDYGRGYRQYGDVTVEQK